MQASSIDSQLHNIIAFDLRLLRLYVVIQQSDKLLSNVENHSKWPFYAETLNTHRNDLHLDPWTDTSPIDTCAR